MVVLKNSKINELFDDFKKKNKDKYEKDEWRYIEDNFFKMLNEPASPDLLMQVYSEMGIDNSSTRFYDRHLKLVKETFSIEGNILDVGSGLLPSFANKIACEQLNLGKGTVTVYEPMLRFVKPKYSNMTLRKREFTTYTDVSQYDLIVGILPCEATKFILESAISNYKDFYIAMCGCVHLNSYFYEFDYGMSPYFYQQQMIALAEGLLKKYNYGSLGVTSLDDYPINYPILYSKKR